MIYEIDIAIQARADLKSIYEYIALTLLTPENAERQLQRLADSIMSLNQMPKRFRAFETEPWKSRGMRIMPVDNYVVLYIPDEDKALVHIARVMYSGRNIPEQLNECCPTV